MSDNLCRNTVIQCLMSMENGRHEILNKIVQELMKLLSSEQYYNQYILPKMFRLYFLCDFDM